MQMNLYRHYWTAHVYQGLCCSVPKVEQLQKF